MATLQESIAEELDVDDRLLNFGALTNGDVIHDLTGAKDYVDQVQPANDDEEDVRRIVSAQLNGEISVLQRFEYSAPLDPESWPRQRRAIERAYAFADSNFAALESAAETAAARKKVLDDLRRDAGDAIKGVGGGLESVLGLVVVIVLLLVLAQLGGRLRA